MSFFIENEISCLNDVRNRESFKFKPRTRNEFRRRLDALLHAWNTISNMSEVQSLFQTIHRLIHSSVHILLNNNTPRNIILNARARGTHPQQIMQMLLDMNASHYIINFESITSLIRFDYDAVCLCEGTSRDVEHRLILELARIITRELVDDELFECTSFARIEEPNVNVFLHPLFFNDNEAIARLRDAELVKRELYTSYFRTSISLSINTFDEYRHMEQIDEMRRQLSKERSELYLQREQMLKEMNSHYERLLNDINARAVRLEIAIKQTPKLVQDVMRREESLEAKEKELEKRIEEFDEECAEYEMNSTKWKANQESLYLRKKQALDEICKLILDSDDIPGFIKSLIDEKIKSIH